MWENRNILRDSGVLFPGADKSAQLFAAQDLQGDIHPRSDGAWRRLVDEAHGHDGDVVISREQLSIVAPDGVARAMADLAGFEVHVVCTARGIAKHIIGMWQEMIKNRQPSSYAEWSDRIRRARPGDALYWYAAPHVVLRTWGRDIPPGHVHVVTVPPSGSPSHVLWDRFAGVVGIDPALGLTEPGMTNPSLGVVETNLLRRLNATSVSRMRWPVYDRLIKNGLAVTMLATRPDKVKLTMPAADHELACRWSAEFVREIRADGYDVVGDLDELLVPEEREPDAPHPDQASDAQMLEVALDTMTTLVRRVDQLRNAHTSPAPRERPSAVRELRRTLGYLADHDHPQLTWLRNRYRGARTALEAWGESRRRRTIPRGELP